MRGVARMGENIISLKILTDEPIGGEKNTQKGLGVGKKKP